MTEAIAINGLVKSFDGKRAVDGLTLNIGKGELFGLLGPNGAGKTTTIRCCATLADFEEGSISICGFDVKKDPVEAKKHMGVIQQQMALDKDLTVRENMISHAMYHMMGKKEREARIAELSDLFGMGEYLDKPVNSLSGGWKKRAAIVCAMLHSPEVLFLDEPTSGLDINARRLLWDVVKRLHSEGTTIVLTTHYIEEAEALCDRVAIIDHGRIIALDTPMELCRRVGSVAVEWTEGEKAQYRYFENRRDAGAFATTVESESGVTIRKTNLEDVFVELTGKSVGGQK